MTESGDLTVGPNGDFLIAQSADALLQSVLFRLKTIAGDWQLMPACGASLEAFIGETASPDTGAAIQAAIEYALTHDGFIAPSELDLRVTPVNSNEVAVLLKIQMDQAPVILISGVDLRQGLLVTPR